MLFNYTAIDDKGGKQSGSIEAISKDTAISGLQRRGLVITSVEEVQEDGLTAFMANFTLFDSISSRDVVLLSRQIASLFEAQVSALRVFRILATETESLALRKVLAQVADEIQGGAPISKALAKFPRVFTPFYTNMVRSGEESGKLDATFIYLADYIDRSYELASKVKNALIYPAFVITTFFVVMILMMTVVIPKISVILIDSGQEIPFYTRMVIGASNFLINYGVFLLIVVVFGAFFLYRYTKTDAGSDALARFQMAVPFIGDLYRKLYLARIADNMSTMLSSGISMVQAAEITASVVDSPIYKEIMLEVSQTVKNGGTVSGAMSNHAEIPGMMVAMMRVGEETGEMGSILKTIAHFYNREVANTVDTLVDLIEPFMIVSLGLGVGILLASVLIPIYGVATGIT